MSRGIAPRKRPNDVLAEALAFLVLELEEKVRQREE